jgi:hypothetical protein
VQPLTIGRGTLSGFGNLTGHVMNSGTVSPGSATATGTLTVTGDYTQASGGVLNIKIGPDCTQFDRFVVTGTGVGHAALAEDLNVRLAGCTPAAGDSFEIMSFNSSTGTFTPQLPPLPPGLEWRVDYAPDSIILRVVQP